MEKIRREGMNLPMRIRWRVNEQVSRNAATLPSSCPLPPKILIKLGTRRIRKAS
jgi:hypothetical protein